MPFVISQGSLASVQRATAPIPFGSIVLSDRVRQDYATIWRTQPQVRTVVSFLARNIAQLGLHVFRRVSDVDRVRLTDHPLAQLLGRPSPHCTRYRTVDALVSDLAIYDNAYWVKIKAEQGGMVALQRIDPRMVVPRGDSPFYADVYEVRGSRGKRDVPADQMVHFRGYNPDDQRVGISPIETLRTLLAEEHAAAVWREQMWRNGARFSGYLRRPAEAPAWSRDAKLRFKAQWQAQYSGSGGQVGGTPVLEDGMEFHPAAVTPEQAQYLEARKLTREEVTAAYHIPLPMVGILDHATFSNITEQHKNLYQDTLGPWLTMICEEIELQLIDDFPDTSGVYVEFNLAEKLRGSFEEQAVQLSTATGGPWMTRNEARARQNLPQIPGADELVVPLNVLTGGQASPADATPPSRDQVALAASRQLPLPLALEPARVAVNGHHVPLTIASD